MDNLPEWAASIFAVAVGLAPGLAVLSARSLARLIYRVVGPRPEVADQLGPERARDEAVIAVPPM